METSTDYYRKAPPDVGASSFTYPPTADNLAFFSEALKAGCVVAIPTETVYGLAALALNPEFCRSIFSIKGRPLMDPLIVHVSGLHMASRLAFMTEAAETLAEAFWPGPLTLIVRKREVVPDIVTAGRETVAMRMPDHPVPRRLIELLDAPLAAPSANPFGYISPSRAEHVANSFGKAVPFVIDGGPCRVGLESTILDLTGPGLPVILRPGAIGPAEVEKVLGLPVHVLARTEDEQTAAKSPGSMARHYSPVAQLTLFENELPGKAADTATVYLKRPVARSAAAPNTFWLSETGGPREIAQSLFGLLRQLDSASFREIRCQVPPADAGGILQAVRDRLTRAAARL